MEEEHLRQVWGGLQQRYGEEHGLDIRIDPTGFVSQPHLGPASCQKGKSEFQARLALVRQANAEAACDPAQVLKKLTEQSATFVEDDLDRLLAKHLRGQADAKEKIAIARFDVLASADLLAMNDKASGDWSGRYSTRRVRDQEQRAIDDATALSAQIGGAASDVGIHGALARHPLLINEKDQKAAFDHAVAPGKLKLIEGRAGTGKSYTLAAIRDAFEDPDKHGRARKRVIGLSHLHVVKGYEGGRLQGSLYCRPDAIASRKEWRRDLEWRCHGRDRRGGDAEHGAVRGHAGGRNADASRTARLGRTDRHEARSRR
jgi:hypothetical protein